jgi:hypothetical protein
MNRTTIHTNPGVDGANRTRPEVDFHFPTTQGAQSSICHSGLARHPSRPDELASAGFHCERQVLHCVLPETKAPPSRILFPSFVRGLVGESQYRS